MTKDEKCKNCGKKSGEHKANTNQCPTGKKGRIGYTSYKLNSFFESKTEANQEVSHDQR